MLKGLCKWMLFRVLGWTVEDTTEKPAKYILAVAPHTSNWDFIIGQLYSRAIGMTCNFMMKEEWFFWPLGAVFRSMGGIPVRRSKNNSLTDQLAEAARKSDTFRLCITPEGTRRRQPEWKRGFYYIALKAGIPILLYGLDFGKKRIVCTKMVVPTGDVEREMREIKSYFAPFQGKYPEKFTTGLED